MIKTLAFDECDKIYPWSVLNKQTKNVTRVDMSENYLTTMGRIDYRRGRKAGWEGEYCNKSGNG